MPLSTVQTLRIGTRGSKLALAQTDLVMTALRRCHPDLLVKVVEIKTSGDWRPEQGEQRLSEAAGGKGLFAREIEQALLAGAIDCGIHSLKDMPSFLPDGLSLDFTLPREDARDAFLSEKYDSLASMPPGATVGTSSLRRQAFILAQRPDLKIVPLRGNVPTRIEKLKAGQMDAAILALAGLKRLGLEAEARCVLAPDDMLPAVGQGIIGIETRSVDSAVRDLFVPLHCRATGHMAAAERAALQVLNGSCHTPIGAHASWNAPGSMTLCVKVAAPDGRQVFEKSERAPVETDQDAAALGRTVGAYLLSIMPTELLT